MAHPHAEMSLWARSALATGILIYSTGLVLTHWRATGKILFHRLIITIVFSACVYFIQEVETWMTLVIALVGLLIMCILEEINSPFTSKMGEGIEVE